MPSGGGRFETRCASVGSAGGGLMIEWTYLFVGAVFVVAGAVKGAVGLGLPPVAMGLMALVLPPVEAAALLVLPAFATNAWQMLAGPSLGPLVRRLWPVLLAIVAGTLAGAGLLTEANARLATLLIGVILSTYALTGLLALRVTVSARAERWLGPIAGACTGVVTAATGVSSVPVVPYFESIGLSKDLLVQAMGLSFSVAALALGVNLARAGALSTDLGPQAAFAVAAAFAGMTFGRAVRERLDAHTFRTYFLLALMGLGATLALRAL